MRRSGGLLTVVLLLILVGCTPDQLGDRGGDSGNRPDHIGDVDYVEVYRNADQFPNISRICVQGLAFASTSSGSRGSEGADADPSLLRVPEWDTFCAAHRRDK